MNMEGACVINAPRATVWAALNDPEKLRQAIPGCQELAGDPTEGFRAVVKQKVGPVSATFKGAVTLSDIEPGVSYTISGEGTGGAAGFAKGNARVRLADAEEGATELSYTVQAMVGGKLAQLGSRLIDGFAKKMADAFFTNFKSALESASDPAKDGEEHAAAHPG
jgi:carbon monoxide dehydrogenase subunit G